MPVTLLLRWSSFAVVTAALLLCDDADADVAGPGAPPIHVLAIRSDDVDEQAEALTSAIRSRLRGARGWSLGEGDYSLEVLSLALRCSEPPDATCQMRIGEQIHSERYIWGSVRRMKGAHQVNAELHMWSRASPPTRMQMTYSDSLTAPGDEVLKRLADDALLRLLGGPSKGTVHIKLADSKGEYAIDGQSSLPLHNGETTVRLSPGDHKIEVRSSSGHVQAATVSVRADALNEVVFAPGPLPDTASVPAPNVPPASLPKDTSESSLRPVVAWSAIGLGAALLGSGLYSALRVHSIQKDDGFTAYQHSFTPDHDVCEEARQNQASPNPASATPDRVRSLCSEASTFQTLQYVFFGLGAVSVGSGVVLLLTGPSAASRERPTAWRVSPPSAVAFLPAAHVGSHGATLRWSWAF